MELPDGGFRVYNDGEIDQISTFYSVEGNSFKQVDKENFPNVKSRFGYVITDLEGAVIIREAILYGVF